MGGTFGKFRSLGETLANFENFGERFNVCLFTGEPKGTRLEEPIGAVSTAPPLDIENPLNPQATLVRENGSSAIFLNQCDLCV